MVSVLLIKIIGTLAVISQIVRIFPQVIKGFMTKKVRDVSIWWEIIASISAVLWLTYGILIKDPALMVGNTITLIAFAMLIYQKIVY
jgi:MtN3 and saliva related transmembrane protein